MKTLTTILPTSFLARCSLLLGSLLFAGASVSEAEDLNFTYEIIDGTATD